MILTAKSFFMIQYDAEQENDLRKFHSCKTQASVPLIQVCIDYEKSNIDEDYDPALHKYWELRKCLKCLLNNVNPDRIGKDDENKKVEGVNPNIEEVSG